MGFSRPSRAGISELSQIQLHAGAGRHLPLASDGFGFMTGAGVVAGGRITVQ
jgi:hypothetical protein